MRTSILERPGIIVLMVLVIPMIILLPDGSLMADKPSFSISNDFEREQTYIPGDWNTIDTITQEYSFTWGETYSSRLDVDLSFELGFKDIFRSLDVDEKTVEPELDLDIKSYIWDMSLTAQDTIDYSNEFNTPRKDALEYGVELNLFPFYLPTFEVQLQQIIDLQDNLEDKVEDKVDANLEYELLDILDVGLSWKEETTDDRLFDNNDIDSHDWEFTLDYGQTLTPAFKVDYKTKWSGSREDTLNNAGLILATDREKELEHDLKFSLDTVPNLDSELELGHLTDFVDDGTETEIDFSIGYDQPIVQLGTLTETLTITRERIDKSTEDTTALDIDIDVELAGTPDKYLDYSVKYTHSLSDLKDGITPTANTDGQEDEFNFSVTATPGDRTTIENSMNWSVTRTDGVKTSSSRDIKINALFEGEMLNIPNLTFTPVLDITKEKDFASGAITNEVNLDLEFNYVFALPPTTSWELGSTYTWSREDSLTRELELTSDFRIELADLSWDVEFEEDASATIAYDTGEPTVWTHDYSFSVGKDLTHLIRFDTTYTYSYDGDGSNTDDIEMRLEWEYRSTFLSMGYTRGRVFEGPQDITRVFTAEFSMVF